MTITPDLHHGRFAPTPSGPLHFGSIVAALGSYLQARAYSGRWSVRLDDLDPQRSRKTAADSILHDLERLGLDWDGEVVRQSQRIEHYRAALADLQKRGLTFSCGCTRAEVRGIYPGTCRDGLPAGRKGRSIRLQVAPQRISFHDAIQGDISDPVDQSCGDFILRRADGVYAYHLAVVVDDAAAGITEIVRGADLLESTPPQILLQQLLSLPTPRYAHLPVAMTADGRKISKQNHAPAIAGQPPAIVLCDALAFLGQDPDPALRRASVTEVHTWASAHWNLACVSSQTPACNLGS